MLLLLLSHFSCVSIIIKSIPLKTLLTFCSTLPFLCSSRRALTLIDANYFPTPCLHSGSWTWLKKQWQLCWATDFKMNNYMAIPCCLLQILLHVTQPLLHSSKWSHIFFLTYPASFTWSFTSIKTLERSLNAFSHQFSSVQFSRSVVSDSLWPHESQHARPPCPSPTPGVHSDSRPSSQWCHPAISSSVVPFSYCP